MAGSDDYTGYLAAPGCEDQLREELGEVEESYGRLLLRRGPAIDAAWAANVWHAPRQLSIESIGDGARQLKAIQRNWALYSHDLHRRAQLIADKLPPLRSAPLAFPCELPAAPLGSWTLLSANTILLAEHCREPKPHGEYPFAEDREGPPSRAYLKLWEALTRAGVHPQPGERCLDLGASPGGWTWVMAQLGAQVIAIDKAPLADDLMASPLVEWRQGSAFALEPTEVGPIDWWFSDIICYPERLLGLVQRWLAAGTVRNFVCTLKFQGVTDHATARAFAAIPHSRLLHLHHNKHELTWIRLEPTMNEGDTP